MRALLLAMLLLVLNGCSGKMADAFKKILDFVTLNKQSSVTLIFNSTTSNQPMCTSDNQVIISSSMPAGRTLYCRDNSVLGAGLTAGPVCPGGPSISTININRNVRECSEITLCGVAPSGESEVGRRSDGGAIKELTFDNLPWGCDVSVDFSFDRGFVSAEATSQLKFYVAPPECPFCASQNQATCETCRDLAGNEVIVSGQVVRTSCSGAACRSCEVLGRPGQTVPHGEGWVYYRSASSSCTQKCSDLSQRRVCNDGLWQGDPAYSNDQCSDTNCGCTLPGSPVTYTHGTVKTIYSTREPPCGVECSDRSRVVECSDGKWLGGTPRQEVPVTELTQFGQTSCSKKVCHCVRANRAVVADGTSRTVYSKNPVSCSESCSDFDGQVSCASGVLSGSTGFGHDSCAQEDCGCRISLPGTSAILLTDGGSTTLYQYSQNSEAVPDACTNPSYKVTVSCNDKVLTPFDPGIFKFKSCTTRPLSCTFTDGAGQKVNVASGSSLTVSVNSNPVCGETCQNLQLKCEDRVFKKRVSGVWTPVDPVELATYRSASACAPKNCDCTVNGFVIPFGGTDKLFKAEKVTDCDLDGCSKISADITCTANGPVSSKGDAPNLYTSKTCESIPCGCPVPWGGTVESGKTVRVFSIQKSTCGNPLACQQSSNFRSVTCTNGALTSYDQTVFKYPACSPEICSCRHATVEVPIGGTLKVFEAEEPPAGMICNAISATLTCNAGGTWSGADTIKYPSTICRDQTDDGIGGGTGGGTGNDEGPGAGIKRRIGLSDGAGGGGGGPCTSTAHCRIVNVSVGIAPLQKQPCILPWGGGEAEFHTNITAFDTPCATIPDQCSSHSITRTCHINGWTGDASYRFPECKEMAQCP